MPRTQVEAFYDARVFRGSPVSRGAWEQQALESIKNGLCGSDPELAALLSAFNRLASDEQMPDTEKMPARTRLSSRLSLRRVGKRLGLQRAVVLLWLLIAATLIATALALNAGGGHPTCTETAAMICVGPANTTSGHAMP